MTARRFDAHCHVFWIDYLVYEAGQIIWDKLCGRYPIHRAPEKGLAEAEAKKPGPEDLLKWAWQLEQAILGDEEKNLQKVLEAVKGSFGDQCTPAAIPLMMDIYYMFDRPFDLDTKVDWKAYEAVRSLPDPKDAPEAFDEQLHALSVNQDWAAKLRARRDVHAVELMEAKGARNPFDTWGLAAHRKALLRLEQERRGTVFPFLAIDPRRAGAIDALRDGRAGVSSGGPFYGVKLYPRLGYHPAHPTLEPLYAFCSKNRIPITTHCSTGGFPTWDHDPKHANLGKPGNFKDALANHENLRIDFAHFGSGGDGWADEILGLMEQFPGRVFSDLSCFTDDGAVKKFYENYRARWATIVPRTMFGTDYDVMAFTKVGTYLEAYHSQFRDALPREDLEAMSSTVVESFLGLDQPNFLRRLMRPFQRSARRTVVT
jgi:predicted TIM-barrel fold metal-dependent hydrolase